jgi:hypothetical protein
VISSTRGRPRSLALPIGLLAALVATFVAISPAMADTVVKHHGMTGVGSLNEREGDVVCNYDAVALSLLSIVVAGPNVFARDTTPHQDSQQIGWQLIVKRTGGGLPTHTIKSPVRKAPATDDTSPMFSPFTYVLDSQPVATAKYHLTVKLFWYKPNGTTVAGWAIHRVDNYTWETPTFIGEYPAPACTGHWG